MIDNTLSFETWVVPLWTQKPQSDCFSLWRSAGFFLRRHRRPPNALKCMSIPWSPTTNGGHHLHGLVGLALTLGFCVSLWPYCSLWVAALLKRQVHEQVPLKMDSPPIFLRRGSRKIGGYPLVYIIYLLDSMPCISRDQEYTAKIHTFFEFQSIKVKIWGLPPILSSEKSRRAHLRWAQ